MGIAWTFVDEGFLDAVEDIAWLTLEQVNMLIRKIEEENENERERQEQQRRAQQRQQRVR